MNNDTLFHILILVDKIHTIVGGIFVLVFIIFIGKFIRWLNT